MKCFKKTSIATLILTFFLLSGCSDTSITGLWKKSDFVGQPFKSILVIALADKEASRNIWEDLLATQLSQSGVKAIKSFQAFPGDKEITKEEVVEYVKQQGIEAVLVTRLVDTNKTKVSFPSTGGSYGHYYNSFGSYYPRAYSSSHWQGSNAKTFTSVILETNLYQSSTQDLVWSFNSDTFDAVSVEKIVKSVGKKMVNQLKKDQLI